LSHDRRTPKLGYRKIVIQQVIFLANGVEDEMWVMIASGRNNLLLSNPRQY
jgi:hypothetical protein